MDINASHVPGASSRQVDRPYSVIVQCTCPRVVTTPAGGASSDDPGNLPARRRGERNARIVSAAESAAPAHEIHLAADPE